MRILYLIPDGFPTFRPDIAVLFGEALPEQGIQTDLATFDARAAGAPSPSWRAGTLQLCAPGPGRAGRHLATFWHLVRTAFSARADRYAAIQVRNMPVVALLALWAARWRGIPFYYWMSYPVSEGQIDLARERGLQAGLMRFLFPLLRGHLGLVLLYRIVLPRADHVFVQSERMREDLAQVGIARHRMTAVRMGVSLQAVMQALPATSGDAAAGGGGPLLGYLGTLDRTRRIDVLFDVLAVVRQAYPGARLLLVGDAGDEAHRRWLRGRASHAGVGDSVIWTGWVPTIEGWRRIAGCDVAFSLFPRGFLLDSASPTKVSEYMALGVPVVCNNNPDQAESIAISGAGRCVSMSVDELAAATLDVLGWSPVERASRIAAGRRYVEQTRDYPIIARELAANYRRLLAIGDSPGGQEVPHQ